jgi:deoxyadenosine/deoxycytidine kinase
LRQAINERLREEEIADRNEYAELQKQLAEQQALYDESVRKRDALKIEVEKLETVKNEAELRESEAIRLSKSKDPKIEELGKW